MSSNLFHLSGYIEEDFTNYKYPSLFLGTCYCDWKCCKDAGYDVCQNKELAKGPFKELSIEKIYDRYKNNPITKAIVIGGLEPFMQFEEVFNLIKYFRDNKDNSIFIIYTGYNKEEIQNFINTLIPLKNIIIKFGRYIPNSSSHYDDILGIKLASSNQYAEKIC